MKRAKVITQPSAVPVFYKQGILEYAGDGHKPESDDSSDTAGVRMLENLQIALFFSRAQSEMAKLQGQ